MQNNDLSRLYPYNPKAPKPFAFVRYNEKGEIEGLPPAETYVGTLTIDHAPTQTELSNFVVTTLGRDPQVNDTIEVVQTISGGADKIYVYKFNGVEWSGHEVPGAELSGNGEPGLVAGNYSVSATADLLLDIENGIVKNIYIKDGQGYRNLVTYINANSDEIANIIDGTTRVAEASHALTADSATNATNASHATTADSATSASSATNADYATSAGTATTATSATNADYATTAGSATSADSATYATSAGSATSATSADYATSAGTATSATTAGSATNDGNGNNISLTYATTTYVDDKTKYATEDKTIATNVWVADGTISPFAYKYVTTFSSNYVNYLKVDLSADPIALAKYGIVIGSTSGNNITFYAQSLPNESVSLKLFFEHWAEPQQMAPATDQYGVPLTDENNVPLMLS